MKIDRQCLIQALGLKCSRFGAAIAKTKWLEDWVPALNCLRVAVVAACERHNREPQNETCMPLVCRRPCVPGHCMHTVFAAGVLCLPPVPRCEHGVAAEGRRDKSVALQGCSGAPRSCFYDRIALSGLITQLEGRRDGSVALQGCSGAPRSCFYNRIALSGLITQLKGSQHQDPPPKGQHLEANTKPNGNRF